MSYFEPQKPITGYASVTNAEVTVGQNIGVLSANDLAKIKYRDSQTFNFLEDTNGLTIVLDYTLPPQEKVRRIDFRGQYHGFGAAHKIDVYVWDWVNNVYVEVSTNNGLDITPSENMVDYKWDIDLPNATNSAGQVRIKLDHGSGGNTSHFLEMDCLCIGDYKAAQMQFESNQLLEQMIDIADRGYMTFSSLGNKTLFDLPDPRIKEADPDKVRVYADMTDDSDFKAVRVPIVDSFINLITPGFYHTGNMIVKYFKSMSGIDSFTDDLRMQKTHFVIPLEDNSIMELVFIPATNTLDIHKILYRILPENATSKEFNSVPSTYQELSTDINNILEVASINDIKWANAVAIGDKIAINYEYFSSSTSTFESKILSLTFDKTTGFSLIEDKYDGVCDYRKTTGTLKLRNGNILCYSYMLYLGNPRLRTVEYDVNFVQKNSLPSIDVLSSYVNNSGVAIANDYSSNDPKDILIAVWETTNAISLYKVNIDTGVTSLFKTLDYPDEISTFESYNFWMYSLPDGEIVISSVDDWDGDRDYYYSKDFGETWFFDEDGVWAQRDSPRFSTDKVYYAFSDGKQGDRVSYRLSPLDLSTFIEAKLDYDDLTIEFSKPPVAGSKFYITEYQKRNVVIENESTFDPDGNPIIKPLVTEIQTNNKPVSETNQLEVTHTTNGRDRFSLSESYNPETFLPRNHMFNVHSARLFDASVWKDFNFMTNYPNVANGYPNGFNAAFYHGLNSSLTHGLYVAPKANRTLYIKKLVLIVEVANKTDISLPIDSGGQTLQLNHSGNIYCDAVALSDLMNMGGNLVTELESVYTPGFTTYYIPIEAFPAGRFRNTAAEGAGTFEDYYSLQLSDGNQPVNDHISKFYVSFEMWETHTDKE